MKLKTLLPYFLVLLIFSSCASVHKNGYHQSRKYKTKLVKKTKNKRNAQEVRLATKETPEVGFKHDLESKRSADNLLANDAFAPIFIPSYRVNIAKASTVPTEQSLWNIKQPSDSVECDYIVLRSGEELSGKITKVGTNEVTYKECDHLDGPDRDILKSDVLFIKYSNGKKEIFENTKTSNDKITPESLDNPGGRVLGVLLLLIGVIVALFVSLIFGIILIGLGIIMLIVNRKRY